MRLPYITLAAMAALSLSGCAHGFPLSSNTVVDDQIGVSVEIAYQGAALAEQTAIRAGYVSPSAASQLIALDNRAFQAVCYTRTAYNVANGTDPAARVDACPPETKAKGILTYAQAAAAAVNTIRDLLEMTQRVQPALSPDAPPPAPMKGMN